MEDSPAPRPLPDDVLADVLSRLAPRSLAVSRCVCREWRAVVDDRCRHLLRPDLLPLTVGGIFVGCLRTHGADTPYFFALPSTTARSRGRVVAGSRLESFMRANDGDGFGAAYDYKGIVDCCNGLLLLDEKGDVVANPATRRLARLPRCDGLSPEGHGDVGFYWSYLAFDPTVSPHYQVLSMQHPYGYGGEGNERLPRLQWPPPVYVMRAYSSETGKWEERRFALDDDEGLQRSITDGERAYGHAAYWHSGTEYSMCIATAIIF